MWDYSRLSYGREGRRISLAWWLVQRGSAVLLGPLVIVHMLVPKADLSVWLGAVLLVLVIAHGALGIVRLADAPGTTRTGHRAAHIAMGATTVALLVAGGALLAALA